VEEGLRRVLVAHSLPCGAVIAAPDAVVSRVGDYEAFGSAGLVSALLGPDGSPAETLAGLAEQTAPELWEQDDEFAVVDQPAPDRAVVVFGRGQGRSTVELLGLAQEVGRTIREAFGEGRREPAARDCERCGRPISPERLQAIPKTVRCWDCQTEVERSG
jgi:hypothetical protein